MTRSEVYFEEIRRTHINRVKRAHRELEEALEAEERDEDLINEIEEFLAADMCGEF